MTTEFSPQSTVNTAILPSQTRLGYAHLRVQNLERSLEFYSDIIGLAIKNRTQNTAELTVSKTADAPVLLKLTEDPNAVLKPESTGLYHLAFRLPTRHDLARLLHRLVDRSVKFTGFSDHLVSEAMYLNDPDRNGLEFYHDRPENEWEKGDGKDRVKMATLRLDLDSVFAELQEDEPEWTGIAEGTDLGHVHLHVRSIPEAEKFYVDVVGFEPIVTTYPGALFVSAGGYHHHLGLNVWGGTQAPPANAVGLLDFSIIVPTDGWSALKDRLAKNQVAIEEQDDTLVINAFDGQQVTFVKA